MLSVKEYGLKTLALSGIAVSGIVLAYSIKHYLKRQKYSHIKGPKTKGILGFFIGQLVDLNEAYKNGSILPQELAKWREEYGNLYKIQFFDKMMVVICDPNYIKEALIEENLPKNEFIYKFMTKAFGVRALGDGIVTLIDHEKWRHKRGLFNHGFQRKFMENWVKEFNDKGDILMEKFRSLADGKTLVTFHTEINRFALDVISSIAFDINTGAITDPTVKLNVLLTDIAAGFNELFNDPLIEMKPNKRSIVKKYARTINDLRDYARQHINRRIKEVENKEYVPNDILSIIISNANGEIDLEELVDDFFIISNANGEIDLEELVDDFLTFFVAGQETTSNAISFTILELGLNPHCFKRARAEIDEVLGSKNEITFEDLSKLEYVNCVFKESLRKWPTIGGFSRNSSKDMNFDGTFIPKGTWIEIPIFVVHRNPAYYPDPEKFEPERFLKGTRFAEQNTINSYTYFPFSLGPRNCIGQNFAQLEAKMFLVKFIKNFDFELDPTQSLKPIEMTTMRPKDGCRIYLKLRQNN